MRKKEFINKYLGNANFPFTSENRDEMNSDLDKVIIKYLILFLKWYEPELGNDYKYNVDLFIEYFNSDGQLCPKCNHCNIAEDEENFYCTNEKCLNVWSKKCKYEGDFKTVACQKVKGICVKCIHYM